MNMGVYSIRAEHDWESRQYGVFFTFITFCKIIELPKKEDQYLKVIQPRPSLRQHGYKAKRHNGIRTYSESALLLQLVAGGWLLLLPG